jgi:hypothetical protein
MHLGAILDGDCLLSSAKIDATLLDSTRLLAREDPQLAAELSRIPENKSEEELEEFLLSA